MQKTTIDFGVQALNPTTDANESVSLKERIESARKSAANWLDKKNDLYSRIADFSVTNRVVLRVNIVTLLVLLAAIAIKDAPIASMVSIGASAWLTFQYNHVKKGGKK